jgi:AMMECR1 domain-containing protein
VLIISKDRSTIYEDIHAGKEKDLEDTLQHLADTMNIFTYIVPAFSTKSGIRKCYGFFEPVNA